MTFISTNVKHASLVRMDTGFPIHKNDEISTRKLYHYPFEAIVGK